MAEDNKAIKYARYAFGEIALVVIGILIALSINNWNESKKAKNSLHTTYSIVLKDLQNDINDIETILEYYDSIKPCYNKILDGVMSKEDFIQNKNCSRILMGYPDFSMDLRGYNLLKNSNNKTNKDSLTIEIVQFYTKNIYEINGNEKMKNEHFNDNYKYWKDNSQWFSDFIKNRYSDSLNEGFLEYTINSQDYKNRVAVFYLLNYEVLNIQYAKFSDQAKGLIKKIEDFNSKM